MKHLSISLLLFAMLAVCSCGVSSGNYPKNRVVMGDEQLKEYLPLLEGRKVALLTNHTGLVGVKANSPHILDVLLKKKVDVAMVFSPEHGFRGDADAGEKVASATDPILPPNY